MGTVREGEKRGREGEQSGCWIHSFSSALSLSHSAFLSTAHPHMLPPYGRRALDVCPFGVTARAAARVLRRNLSCFLPFRIRFVSLTHRWLAMLTSLSAPCCPALVVCDCAGCAASAICWQIFVPNLRFRHVAGQLAHICAQHKSSSSSSTTGESHKPGPIAHTRARCRPK
jgi:hypothetical protein